MTEVTPPMPGEPTPKPTRPYRRAALVTQPHPESGRAISEVAASAAQLGLVTHLPPSGPWASINFPDITLFIVVIGPDMVHLPTEQKCSEWFDEHLKLERALLREREEGGPTDELRI
jgi:hypothetical protein